MASHEIVPLKCPSCGSSTTGPSKQLAFGAEFSCAHCGCTSVLIINRELVALSSLQKQGEKVCTICGRVAQREARFCQEGHALVRKCINCFAQFAVDHQRCDFCGWLQSVNPDTVEGETLAFDRAVSDLANVDYSKVQESLRVIIAGGGTASGAAATAAVSAILSLMKDPSFRRLSHVHEDGHNYTEQSCWKAIGRLGPAARQAVPMVRQRLEKLSSEGSKDESIELTLLSCLAAISPEDAVPMLRQELEKNWLEGWSGRRREWLKLLGTISPEDALAYCSRSLEEGGNDEKIEFAVHTAFVLGKVAIPTLEKFSGFCSSSRRWCKAAISALRNGETSFRLP